MERHLISANAGQAHSRATISVELTAKEHALNNVLTLIRMCRKECAEYLTVASLNLPQFGGSTLEAVTQELAQLRSQARYAKFPVLKFEKQGELEIDILRYLVNNTTRDLTASAIEEAAKKLVDKYISEIR